MGRGDVCLCAALVLASSLFSITATAENSDGPTYPLEVSTDKYQYLTGEPIAITLTNVGDQGIAFSTPPELHVVNSGGAAVVDEYWCLKLQVIVGLAAGEEMESGWDQTHLICTFSGGMDPMTGSQVPPGKYLIAMGHDNTYFGEYRGPIWDSVWIEILPQEFVPGPPSAPRNLCARAGNDRVTLTWSPPESDGGSPVTGYAVYRSTVPAGEVFVADAGLASSYYDLGLTNGQTYYYAVTAKNKAGESGWSNEVSARPARPPSEPLNPAALAGDGQVTLSWSPPADDGGSPITGYVVYRASAGGAKAPIARLGNALAYIDTDVSNGVTYSYSVKATNSMGEGPSSGVASASPSAPASNTENATETEQPWMPGTALPVAVLAAVLVFASALILALRRRLIGTK